MESSKRKIETEVSSSSDVVSAVPETWSSYETNAISAKLHNYVFPAHNKKPNLTGGIWDMDEDLPSTAKVRLKLKEPNNCVDSDDEIIVLDTPEISIIKNECNSRKKLKTAGIIGCDPSAKAIQNMNTQDLKGVGELIDISNVHSDDSTPTCQSPSKDEDITISDEIVIVPNVSTVDKSKQDVLIKSNIVDIEKRSIPPVFLGCHPSAKGFCRRSSNKESVDDGHICIRKQGHMVFADKGKRSMGDDSEKHRKKSITFQQWAESRMKKPDIKIIKSPCSSLGRNSLHEEMQVISSGPSKQMKKQNSDQEISIVEVVAPKKPDIIVITDDTEKKKQITNDTIQAEWMKGSFVQSIPKKSMQGIETPLVSPLTVLADWMITGSSTSSPDSVPGRRAEQSTVARQPRSSPKYGNHSYPEDKQSIARQPRTSSRYSPHPYQARQKRQSVKVVITVFNNKPSDYSKMTVTLKEMEDTRRLYTVVKQLVPGLNHPDKRLPYSTMAIICVLRFAFHITYVLPNWEVAVEVYAIAHHFHLTHLMSDCTHYFNNCPLPVEEVLDVAKVANYYGISDFISSTQRFKQACKTESSRQFLFPINWKRIPKFCTLQSYVSCHTYVECIIKVPLVGATNTGMYGNITGDIQNDVEFLVKDGIVKLMSLQLKLDILSQSSRTTHISMRVTKDNENIATIEVDHKLSPSIKLDLDKDIMARAGSRLKVTVMLEDMPFKYCSILHEEKMSQQQFIVNMSSSKKYPSGNALFFIESVVFE